MKRPVPWAARAALAAALAGSAAWLAGCAAVVPPPPAVVQAPTVLGLWRVEQARSEPLLDKRRARLDFGADGRLSGDTSCNRLSAGYSLAGDRLTLSPVVTTRMACSGLAAEQEDRILTALELAATARVRPDGILELRDAAGRGLLRAIRFPAEAKDGERP